MNNCGQEVEEEGLAYYLKSPLELTCNTTVEAIVAILSLNERVLPQIVGVGCMAALLLVKLYGTRAL